MFNPLFSPIFIALTSLIIPGLGQFILGYEKRGIYFAVIYIVLFILDTIIDKVFFLDMFYIISIIISIGMFICEIYAAYDAYKLAKIQQINKEGRYNG